MELSQRLQAVVDLLDSHSCVADIGCDHGFVSISLIRSKKAEKCIAMDVNKGPIERAAEHIIEEGLSTYIETRLSDGGKELQFQYSEEGKILEVQAAIIAGMGGKLTIKIIEDSLEKFLSMEEFILQPQSEIWKVREYLDDIGCSIVKEDMIFEDGKFYPMMKVSGKEHQISEFREERKRDQLFYHYGEKLLKNHHPVLYEFLLEEKKLYEDILRRLSTADTEKTQERIKELKEKMNLIHRGLEWFLNEM